MPALHALFCLRLWVFGFVFVRYKALEIRVLFFLWVIYSGIEKNSTFASGMAEQSGGVKREKGGALRLLAA